MWVLSLEFAIVTIADYIAPLNEAGDITPKYEIIRELIRRYEVIPKGIILLIILYNI